MTRLYLHPDRLFPADPGLRDIARRLYNEVRNLPIVSPHGHTDPAWFSTNTSFDNPAELLIIPDRFTDIIERIGDHPINRIDDFLPWKWQETRPSHNLEKAA